MTRTPTLRFLLGSSALAIAAMSASACSKQEPVAAPVSHPQMEESVEASENLTEAATEDPAAEVEAAAKAEAEAAATAQKKAEAEAAQLKRLQDALAKLEETNKVEQKRWTKKVKNNTKKLAKRNFKNPKLAIKAAVASAHRKPANVARDGFRHPLQTLSFFGLTPTSNVIELSSGGGWYTEIIAPVVAKKGQFTIDAAGEDPVGLSKRRRELLLASSPELYGKLKTYKGSESGEMVFGEPESADLLLTFRSLHGMNNRKRLNDVLAGVHQVLKPGGVFGVVQHRAAADANPEESSKKGYLPEAWVIAQVEAAGFKLDKKSEINANPKDTKDYGVGVWALPPVSYGKDGDNKDLSDAQKAKYKAIGESDRMTLRFVKVKK